MLRGPTTTLIESHEKLWRVGGARCSADLTPFASLALRATLLLELGGCVHAGISVVPLDAGELEHTARHARLRATRCCRVRAHRVVREAPCGSMLPSSRTRRAQREPHGTARQVLLDATEWPHTTHGRASLALLDAASPRMRRAQREPHGG